MGTLPWVDGSSPRDTDQEQDRTGAEESHSTKIKLFELLPLVLPLDVKLRIGGWVI